MKKNNCSGKKILIRFLMPYMFILLIPLFFGMLIYYKTLDMVENDAVKANTTLLEQTKETLDRSFAEIDTMVQQIAREPKVMNFQYVKKPFEGATTYQILETRKALLNYDLHNNFMFDYFLLFKNSDLAMAANMTYRLPEFYKHVLKYNNMKYEDWYGSFLNQYHHKEYLPAASITIGQKPHSMVAYIQSLGYPNHYNGSVVVLIDNKEIQKLLSRLDISDGGWAYIADEKGQIISFTSTSQDDIIPVKINKPRGFIEQFINSKNMFISYTTSKNNGWTFVAAQPSHIVMRKVNYIKRITLSVVVIWFLIGAVISYFMAYRNSRPIKNLVQTIMERFEGEPQFKGDAYGLIQDTLSRLIHNNGQLEIKIKEHIPLLRAAFFERLLKGGFNSEKDIETILKHVGIKISGKYYIAAILHLREYDHIYEKKILRDLDIKRVLVKDVLRNTFEAGNVHDVEEDKIALLFTCTKSHPEECKRNLKQVIEHIKDELYTRVHFNPAIAVGGIYENLKEVSRSYKEAREALDFKIWEMKNDVIWYSDLPKVSKGFYYPEDVELRLMNFVKAGNIDEVEKILRELHSENFLENRISLHMLRLFSCEMWGSIVKLLDQVPLDGEEPDVFIKSTVNHMGSFKELEENYQDIINTFYSMCDVVNERKKSHNERLITNVVNLLQTTYMKPELCLAAISDQFNISEVYLSHFFKEQTGVNFSEYVESIRMDNARKLILKTDLSINEVAGRVGYNSSNTFCRAFKRIHGMSATIYKGQQVNNKAFL